MLKLARGSMLVLLPHSLAPLGVGALRHASATAAQYAPLRRDPSLFAASSVSGWLDERFSQLLTAVRRGEEAPFLIEEVASEVYTFPLLRAEACGALAAEVDHFGASGLEARRPNSMNNYGLVLNDIGLRPALTELQSLVQPVLQALFPTEGAQLDDHHSFVVSYRPEEDKGLDMHTDDSDVTLNVCLGDDFEASGLTFCGNVGAPDHRQLSTTYQHTPGRAVVHLGRRRHGADDIQRGRRINLIMWNYNRPYRNSAEYRARAQFYAREAAPPAPECTSFTHDRDYAQVRGDADPQVRLKAAKFASRAWCPPPSLEYEGFRGGAGRYRAIDPLHRDLMD
ncbi:hypothetical protein AB1Y20_010341 [Prymnesium parvum]|uniref:Fe2OG dioxygenase domain-containing protein n=1 Tax=Prymnesium parvum TaxID=97485 RepID=A0AB34K822_PRYPA